MHYSISIILLLSINVAKFITTPAQKSFYGMIEASLICTVNSFLKHNAKLFLHMYIQYFLKTFLLKSFTAACFQTGM